MKFPKLMKSMINNKVDFNNLWPNYKNDGQNRIVSMFKLKSEAEVKTEMINGLSDGR
jgi:hypothetical protein